MRLKHGVISVDDHIQEPPDLWTSRLSRNRWGDRIPHLERSSDGSEHWLADAQVLFDHGVSRAGALMADRNREPRSWQEVPRAAYLPAERLKAMDASGVDYSVLYPTVAGIAGEAFGRLRDPELELACVRAYNDWLIEEWGGASERFIPQCIVPIAPIEATVSEIRRAVGLGHRGVIFPALPMHLRPVPHVSGPEYDPVWAVCEELNVPVCLHAGASPELQYTPYQGLTGAGRSYRRGNQAGVECIRHFTAVLSPCAATPPEAAHRARRKRAQLGHALHGMGRPSVRPRRARPRRLPENTVSNVSKPVSTSPRGLTRSRRLSTTSAPSIFSGQAISRWRRPRGRAPGKPSFIASSQSQRKRARKYSGKTQRASTGFKQ